MNHIPLPGLTSRCTKDEELYNARAVRAYAMQLAMRIRDNTTSASAVVTVAKDIEDYILNGKKEQQ